MGESYPSLGLLIIEIIHENQKIGIPNFIPFSNVWSFTVLAIHPAATKTIPNSLHDICSDSAHFYETNVNLKKTF